MTTKPNTILSLTAVVALFLASTPVLNAQPQITAAQLDHLEQQGPVDASTLPSGTFWLASNLINSDGGPPLPFSPNGLPVFILDAAQNIYIIDDISDQAAAILSQAGSRSMSAAFDLTPPPDDGSGTNDSGNGDGGSSGSNSVSLYTTNDLYLAILSATQTNTSSTAQLTVHAPEQEDPATLFDIFVAPSLNNLKTPYAWTWAMRTPAATNLAVDGLPLNSAFFIVGRTNTSGMWGDNLSLALKMLWGLDTNSAYDPTISFTLQATNTCTTSSAFNGSISVNSGFPTMIATLVNNTNFGAAQWQPLTTPSLTNFPFSVDLGPDEGRKEMWIGLAGPSPDVSSAWAWAKVIVDRTAPVLCISNPLPGVTDQPIIQIQGSAPERLALVSYDLSNANGSVSNQPAFVVDETYSVTNKCVIATAFQCYDVPLALGNNVLTVRAVDVAGNVGTTNFTVTFDPLSNTNLPVVNVTWPADGTAIGSSVFSCFGVVDNPSATVTASMVDANGQTNLATAVVERDGHFWLNGLPLDTDSTLTLTAVSPAGVTTVASMALARSPFDLTVYAISGDSLNQPPISPTGTIGTNGYDVYVNGILATVDDSLHWSANGVPLDTGTMAVVLVQAVPQGGGNQMQSSRRSASMSDLGGSGPTIEFTYVGERPPRFFMSKYEIEDDSQTWVSAGLGFYPEVPQSGWYHEQWTDNAPGYSKEGMTWWEGGTWWREGSWGNAWWPGLATGTSVDGYGSGYDLETNSIQPSLAFEQWDAVSTTPYDSSMWSITDTCTAQTGMKYAVNGLPGETRLVIFSATATDYGPDGTGPGVPVPPGLISIGSLGNLGPDGTLPVLLAAGSVVDATARAGGTGNATPSQSAPPDYLPQLTYNSGNSAGSNVYIIGQHVDLQCVLVASPGAPALTNVSYSWTVTGDTVGNYVPSVWSGIKAADFSKTSSEVVFYWYRPGSYRATCTVTAAGKTFPPAVATFNVKAPEVQLTASVTGEIRADNNNIYVPPGVYLHFGGYVDGTNRVPGILFQYNIVNSNDCIGPYSSLPFCQTGLVRRTQTSVTGTLYTLMGVGVDNRSSGNWFYPYHPQFGPHRTSDSPAHGTLSTTYTNATTDEHYEMWLMFQADTRGGSILVPLKAVSWSWSASAVITNAASNQWQVTAQQPPTNLATDNSPDFPQWSAPLWPYLPWSPTQPPP